MKFIMKKFKIKINKEILFYLFLILYLFYYSYRYVLKYNSTGTSSTYANTPPLFQYGKFFIMIILIGLLYYKERKILWNEKTKPVFFSILYLTVSGFVLAICTKNTEHLKFIIMLIPLLFYCDQSFVDEKKFERIMYVYLIFCIIYEFIQLGLYKAVGRLPALAYPTGKFTDVRFGGAIDDPNGFGLILCFYLPYCLLAFRGKKRVILTAISGIMLILTWSVTAVIAIVMSVLILILLCQYDRHLKNIFKITMILFICALILGLILFGPRIISSIQYFISNKQGSVAGHQESWNFSDINLLTFFGLSGSNLFSEVGILRLFYCGGLIAVILFYYLGVKSIRNLLRKSKNNSSRRPLYYSLCIYQIAFMIEMLNLPVIYLFTNVGLYLMILVVSLQQDRLEIVGEN